MEISSKKYNNTFFSKIFKNLKKEKKNYLTCKPGKSRE